MELRSIFKIVWKWAWLAILAVVIAGTTSYFASKAVTPLYRTTTTIMIGGAIQDPNANVYQITTSQQLALTYVQLANRENVLQGTIKALGLNMDWTGLAGQVSASNIPNTQLLQITVIDSDPYRAKVLADEVAHQLILQGPASSGANSPEQIAFAQKQLDDLKSKIETGQQDLAKLNQDLDAANSARQIQDLQAQVSILQNKINDWQNTYAQLLLSVGGGTNSLSVVEPAAIPGYPFSPNTSRNVLVAVVIGLALAAVGVTLIEYIDDTIKVPDDFTRAIGLPALGAIVQIEGNSQEDKLVSVKEPFSPITEAYRALRTNLQFSFIDQPMHTLIFTSAGPGDGKSITVANLAVVLAQTGRKVIVLDADLRRPTQHLYFGLQNRFGLTDALLQAVPFPGLRDKSTQPMAALPLPVVSDAFPILAGEADPTEASTSMFTETHQEPVKTQKAPINHPTQSAKTLEEVHPVNEFLQDTEVENLRLLTTGRLPPNASDLLGSERMAHLLELLKAEADLILVDSPPVLLLADAAILGSHLDGAILVIDSSKTRIAETRRAVDELRKGHINVVGGVINRMPRGRRGYYYRQYYTSEEGGSRKKKKNNRLIDKLSGLPSQGSKQIEEILNVTHPDPK